MSDLVRVEWEIAPTKGQDGHWYRTFTVVDLPPHIAESASPTVRILPNPENPRSTGAAP